MRHVFTVDTGKSAPRDFGHKAFPSTLFCRRSFQRQRRKTLIASPGARARSWGVLIVKERVFRWGEQRLAGHPMGSVHITTCASRPAMAARRFESKRKATGQAKGRMPRRVARLHREAVAANNQRVHSLACKQQLRDQITGTRTALSAAAVTNRSSGHACGQPIARPCQPPPPAVRQARRLLSGNTGQFQPRKPRASSHLPQRHTRTCGVRRSTHGPVRFDRQVAAAPLSPPPIRVACPPARIHPKPAVSCAAFRPDRLGSSLNLVGSASRISRSSPRKQKTFALHPPIQVQPDLTARSLPPLWLSRNVTPARGSHHRRS